MGLLNSNSLNEWATAIPDRAKALYQGLLNAPAELKQLLDPKFQQGLLASVTNKPFDKQSAAAMAMDLMPNPIGLVGQTVYHGSPHKFTKFDMSKIGTGEGAQAYGHGLYFAENRAVANEYAGPLNAARETRPVGNVDLAQAYQSMPTDVPENLWAARRDFRTLLDMGELSPADKRDFLSAVQNNITASRGGNLYKVDIPDEAIPRMLDWDKPLSEQAPEVRAALKAAAEARAQQTGGAFGPLDMSQFGRDVVPTLGEGRLKNAGIPGIRYLDGNSRGVGGTSNYVLFDDQLPRILEVNGQPTGLLPWADEAKKTKKK